MSESIHTEQKFGTLMQSGGVASKLGVGPGFWIVGLFLLAGVPILNTQVPPESFFHLSDFTVNLFGKYLAYAILAIGIDLIWGYTGVLSLGHGVFFALGAYSMGMYLALGIGTESVYGELLPDFMVWNQVKELPLFWKPHYSFAFTIAAIFFVPMLFATAFRYLAFRSRILGVYFAIITQALVFSAWPVFNRNETNLGGTNGLTDFKQILGFRLGEPSTQLACTC